MPPPNPASVPTRTVPTVDPAEQPPLGPSDDHGRRQPAAPAEPLRPDALIAALLLDPSCPGRSRRGAREIEVDRFLAFAYSRGLSLAGLERHVDRIVKNLGGSRTDPPTRAEAATSSHRGRRIPIYRLPEDADGPAIRRTGRHPRPARPPARTDAV